MKLLVTVGTTPFDSLIKRIDEIELDGFVETLVQCAEGIPSHKYQSISFINGIENEYRQSDIIVTHAGAGSIYALLELQRRIVVVPNLDRDDSHQSDIAKFVEDNGYAKVCWDLKTLQEDIISACSFSPRVYNPTRFFVGKNISDLIKAEYLR